MAESPARPGRMRATKSTPVKPAPGTLEESRPDAIANKSPAGRSVAGRSVAGESPTPAAATSAVGTLATGPSAKGALSGAASIGGKVIPMRASRNRRGLAATPDRLVAEARGTAHGAGVNRDAGSADPVPARPPSVGPTGWERKAASGLAFLRRRLTGAYHVDEFGFDPDLFDHVLSPTFRPLYEKWFRTEVIGVGNIPTDSGALLVANHAGALWAMDGVMTMLAVHDSTPGNRYLRTLGADLVFSSPVIGPLARKGGITLACNPDAERLLSNGELVGVWPEGFKGIGKKFSERYKLQRFGRGGFVTAAVRTGVPIIPVSIVGAEEIHPMIADLKPLARLLGLPYFPITPTFPLLGPLGLIPLPSKWYIEFGEPIPTDHLDVDAADDPMLTFELTDRVRETIQGTLYRLLSQRTSTWK